MDHTEAVRSSAAERYAIGDLPVAEVEEFERHFFECSQCSEELRTLTILASDARAVFAEAPVPVIAPQPEPRVADRVKDKVTAWWRQPWILGPAFAALAVIVFVSLDPGLRQPSGKIEQVSQFPLRASARGKETLVTPSAGATSFTLYMDKTWDGSADSYRAVIRDEAGDKQRAAFTLKDPGAGHFIEISIPAHALPAGDYVLVVEDSASPNADLARYPFTLRFE
jgi:hypothetical protein